MEDKHAYHARDPIARLAARQYGVVTVSQLRGLGCGRGAIRWRVQNGRLIPVHRGVYFVEYVRREPIALAAAAVLGGGHHAVLSHFSASALYRLSKRWPDIPEITLTRGDRRPPGIHVHTSTVLAPRDLRRQLGIRATSPARTLLDIAPDLPASALARAVNDARLNRLTTTDALNDVVHRNRTNPGSTVLARFIELPGGACTSSRPARPSG